MAATLFLAAVVGVVVVAYADGDIVGRGTCAYKANYPPIGANACGYLCVNPGAKCADYTILDGTQSAPAKTCTQFGLCFYKTYNPETGWTANRLLYLCMSRLLL